MKKVSLLAFTLSLFLVLFFNSCESDKFPDPKKNKVVVEVIEQNYLALKPSILTKSSYNNPRNIFLEKKSRNSNTNTNIYNWYRKTNGVYQIFSLNDQSSRELDQELAYEIIDTLNVSSEAYQINKDYAWPDNKPLEVARQKGSFVIEKITKKEILSQYFWLKTRFITQDSLLNYQPKTKSFFINKTKIVSEIKTDLGPIILVLLFFLFSMAIVLRDRLGWLKKIREKIFNSLFNDYFMGAARNDHRLNSLILFLLLVSFHSIYFTIWNGYEHGFNVFISVIFGLWARFFYWLDVTVSDTDNFTFTKISSISIISVILLQEMMAIKAPLSLITVSVILILSPAIINLIIEVIKYRKLKKWIASQPDIHVF